MEPQSRSTAGEGTDLVYSPVARAFHWITVLLVLLQIPLGFYMVWRGNATSFDATTNTLYSGHKLLGFAILWFVVLRLLYRITYGAPRDEPTLAWFHKAAAHLTHWGLYVLLIGVAVLGWLGVSYYGALGTLFGLSLPSLAAQNQDKADWIFKLHGWGVLLIMAAVAMHVLAAIYHHFIRGDGVLRRMWPGLAKRG